MLWRLSTSLFGFLRNWGLHSQIFLIFEKRTFAFSALSAKSPKKRPQLQLTIKDVYENLIY
jgi:hypothetical protein